jgi:glutamine synthetase
MGFEMEVSHHEVAFGQHEINFHFDNALEACDNIQTFKIVVKNVARRHGYHATFMPKPIQGINGSGMHTNCSLSNDGVNLFYDPKTENQLSDTALKFIAGVMKYAQEFALLTNPTINSYKRLVPGFEAPCYISWSDANRSTMVRIPAARGNATRIEVRSVDPSANPYLAMAGLLASGLEGIKNDLNSLTPVKKNLPESLKEAIDSFSNSSLMKETVGDFLYAKLIEAKHREWDEYKIRVTSYELEKYLPII